MCCQNDMKTFWRNDTGWSPSRMIENAPEPKQQSDAGSSRVQADDLARSLTGAGFSQADATMFATALDYLDFKIDPPIVGAPFDGYVDVKPEQITTESVGGLLRMSVDAQTIQDLRDALVAMRESKSPAQPHPERSAFCESVCDAGYTGGSRDAAYINKTACGCD